VNSGALPHYVLLSQTPVMSWNLLVVTALTRMEKWRLNGTYGVMVRSLLYSAGLPPKYWSAALVHAVHLKNRLWHSALNCTPLKCSTCMAIARKPERAFFLDAPGIHTVQNFMPVRSSACMALYFTELSRFYIDRHALLHVTLYHHHNNYSSYSLYACNLA
jgi:hypothetical protein